jgi:hypothetical protein
MFRKNLKFLVVVSIRSYNRFMGNFGITPPDSGLLTIVKPLGKPVSLRVGEIIEAKILDFLATGALTLKIRGGVLTAKTDIPFTKDASVLLKVLGVDKSGGELRLQFIGYPASEATAPQTEQFKGDIINKLMQDLSKIFSKNNAPAGHTSEAIGHLLKALPQDIRALPQDMRLQLQNLLQAKLKSSGETVISKLDHLLGLLSQDLPEKEELIGTLKVFQKEMMVSIERLEHTPLKNALNNTGVALEAKLKTLVSLLQRMEGTASKPDMSDIRMDLKAHLLQLGGHLTTADRKGTSELVNGLLKDIETFQLMSKVTDSFYTFLPVFWDQIKNGDISFKKDHKDDKGRSFSCRISLDLERLGELDIVVLMSAKEFFVYFKIENDGFRDMLNSTLKELGERFAKSGLHLKGTLILDKNIPPAEMENLGAFEGKVNIKI